MRCFAIPRCGAAFLLLTLGVPFASAQSVRGFGVPKGKLPPKTFGNPTGQEDLRIRFPHAAANIVGDDLALARSQIDRTDADGDGITTQQEWADSGHSTPRHFTYHDLNGDGILTLYEHSIGVAAWRLRNERRSIDRASQENAARKRRLAEQTPAAKNLLVEPEEVHPQIAARRQQVDRLAAYLIRTYDADGNGQLDPHEARRDDSSYGGLSSADGDGDRSVSEDELAAWLRLRLPPLSQLPLELQSRDTDADGQVSLAEFASGHDRDALAIEEFQTRDHNGDGWITPAETSRSRREENRFENSHASVLKPSASVVSDIHVDEGFTVERLTLFVNLQKQNDNFTEVLLITPNGERVVLFAGNGWQPWRGGQILDGVTFDDDAPLIKEILQRPPWQKRLRPTATDDNRATLASVQGVPARGRWRLIVRNQNERVGMLVNWSLNFTASDEVAK